MRNYIIYIDFFYLLDIFTKFSWILNKNDRNFLLGPSVLKIHLLMTTFAYRSACYLLYELQDSRHSVDGDELLHFCLPGPVY